jgi:hypothetical protein
VQNVFAPGWHISLLQQLPQQAEWHSWKISVIDADTFSNCERDIELDLKVCKRAVSLDLLISERVPKDDPWS